MVLTIFYPENKTEWYAKGTAKNNVYFEVPAVFSVDDTCDVDATYAAVEQFLVSLDAS